MNMQRSLAYTAKFEELKPSPVGSGLVAILLGTALLSLQTPARDYLFPHAPYFMLGLQLGVFVLLIPLMRIKLNSVSFALLVNFCALFVWALISSFWSPYPELVFRRTLMILVTTLLINVLTLADTKPAVTFVRLAKALALFGAAMSLLGLAVYFFGKLEVTELGTVQSVVVGPLKISQRVYGPLPFLRMSSLFGNPNTLASWLLVTLTMTVYLIFSRPHRAIWGLLMLFQGGALILTFSRAGSLAVLISLGLLWLFSASNRRVRKKRALVFGLFGLGLIFLAVSLYPTAPRRFSVDLNLRALAWAPLWAYIHTNPVLGAGFGVSYEAILEPAGVQITAHNAFLAILSELGVPGLLLFLSVWLFSMWHAWKNLRYSSPPLRLILTTSLGISVALFFHQIFEGSILRYGFHTLIWAYLLASMVHHGPKAANTKNG